MSKAPDRRNSRLRRRGFAIALALVLLVAFQWFVVAKPGGAPPAESTPPPFDTGEGSCDVDGVEVFWDAGFFGGTGSATVRSVTIAGVAPSCAGADLTVTLQEDSTDVGEYVALQTQVVQDIDVANGRVRVAFAPFVDARRVTNVYVELAGGTMPIPAECVGMQFKNYTIGSNEADTIQGFQLANLIYGLDGDDTIQGGQQDDCLAGQGGPDTIRGGPGKDVLVGGEGDDILYGEQGSDRLYGGPGTDKCVLESKQDKAFDCEQVIGP